MKNIVSLNYLWSIEQISSRTLTVCQNNGWVTLQDVIDYFDTYQTFSNLEGVGARTEKELNYLCIELSEELLNRLLVDANNNDVFFNKLLTVTGEKERVFNLFLEIQLSKATVRLRNALSNYFNGVVTLKAIIQKLRKDGVLSANTIPNIGNRSEIEFKLLIDKVLDFAQDIFNQSEERLHLVADRLYIENKFAATFHPSSTPFERSIFYYINYLIKEDLLAPFQQNTLIKRYFNIFEKRSALALEEVAERLDLSYERVRQIRTQCIENLSTTLAFIRDFEEDLSSKYSIPFGSSILYIDQALADRINSHNNTDFTKEFIAYVLQVYWKDHYTLIGSPDSVFQPSQMEYQDRYSWRHFYLVSNEIAEVLDFESLALDLRVRLKSKINASYVLSLETYLQEFLNPSALPKLSEAMEVTKLLISQEFQIECTDQAELLIERNTKKQLHEYIKEALIALDKPSKVEAIYEYVFNHYLEVNTTQEAIRSTLSNDAFIYFGKTSTYGLAKWETERDGIKGGTIRDIVYSFLTNRSEPAHITEIAEEVLKYRPETTVTSILSNLSQVEKERFAIFNQGFIGLSGVTYESKLTNLPKMLGRSIREYVRLNPGISMVQLSSYFSTLQEVSEENMNRILQRLFENNYLSIDGNNFVYVDASDQDKKEQLALHEEIMVSEVPSPTKEYSPGLKMEIVLALLRNPDSIHQLASNYNISPNLIHNWRHQLILNAPRVFM